MILRARQRLFQFPRPALVMGVLNVTPDSFSDGGLYFEREAAVARALALEAAGAEIIDIGGESTRPQAEPVSEAEEIRRVLPVIERLSGRLEAAISIDTQKPEVARRALEAGACMVNDVAAHRGQPDLWKVVAGFGAAYVAMHMQGTPATMQVNPVYADVTGEIADFFQDRLEHLAQAGVQRETVVLDVGIGFGKTLEHNLQLLGQLEVFTRFERPLLLGASRKSFLGALLGAAPEQRLPGSLACACWGVLHGVNLVRVHDVAATVQALRMIEAIQARQN